LDALPDRYVLEVSSPGVDRPLTRRRDYERFVGELVAVKGDDVLVGKARRLEGELLGLARDAEGQDRVRLRLPGGDEVEIPRDEITGAHLVFRWS
jgi:ribosome maturation factor RimP